VTFVHKGNIAGSPEGWLPAVGYALAEREFPRETYTRGSSGRTKLEKGEERATERNPRSLGPNLIKDAIADITLQRY
jgi:isocitrate dehydrogenase